MKKAYIVGEQGIAIVTELIARTVSGSFFLPSPYQHL
jgi:hypothetical protein